MVLPRVADVHLAIAPTPDDVDRERDAIGPRQRIRQCNSLELLLGSFAADCRARVECEHRVQRGVDRRVAGIEQLLRENDLHRVAAFVLILQALTIHDERGRGNAAFKRLNTAARLTPARGERSSHRLLLQTRGTDDGTLGVLWPGGEKTAPETGKTRGRLSHN